MVTLAQSDKEANLAGGIVSIRKKRIKASIKKRLFHRRLDPSLSRHKYKPGEVTARSPEEVIAVSETIEPATKVKLTGHAIGLHEDNVNKLIEKIEKGLPLSSVSKFQKEIGLSLGETLELIKLNKRTFDRRKKEGKLHADESERLVRLVRIYEKAVELFEGQKGPALTWLTKPKKALSGNTPLQYAKTEIGAKAVEDLIGRLEHGVF